MGQRRAGVLTLQCEEAGEGVARFIIERAGPGAAERHARVNSSLPNTPMAPTVDLRDIAEELYAEVGSFAMTLIGEKVKRVRKAL